MVLKGWFAYVRRFLYYRTLRCLYFFFVNELIFSPFYTSWTQKTLKNVCMSACKSLCVSVCKYVCDALFELIFPYLNFCPFFFKIGTRIHQYNTSACFFPIFSKLFYFFVGLCLFLGAKNYKNDVWTSNFLSESSETIHPSLFSFQVLCPFRSLENYHISWKLAKHSDN